MVGAGAPFEPGRAGRWLDAADQPRRSKRVQRLINGLEGDVAHAVAHPGGKCLDVEVITTPDRLQQGDTGSRHPQAGPAQSAPYFACPWLITPPHQERVALPARVEYSHSASEGRRQGPPNAPVRF